MDAKLQARINQVRDKLHAIERQRINEQAIKYKYTDADMAEYQKGGKSKRASKSKKSNKKTKSKTKSKKTKSKVLRGGSRVRRGGNGKAKGERRPSFLSKLWAKSKESAQKLKSKFSSKRKS